MDQNSFRRLLQTQKPGSTASPSPVVTVARPKSIDASQPAFKPRKVKKTSESKYRDRAGERRQGGGNDYSEVEAVLEEFERRHANNVDKDEKRKYLGGDSEHSILVKGLDMALLAANKAKAAALSIEDDDTLERAFTEQDLASASELNVAPQKRTREDLIRELKEKRGQTQAPDNHSTSEEGEKVFEEAKKAGKFKPIGFKPIAEERSRKMKVKDDAKEGQRKKKKRKLDEGQTKAAAKDIDSAPDSALSVPAASDHFEIPASIVTVSGFHAREQEPKQSEEFDIFADVGEYEGLDIEGELEGDTKQAVQGEPASVVPPRWIAMEEEDLLPELPSNESLPRSPLRHRSCTPNHNMQSNPEAAEIEDEKPVRLQPLESSALPSIKDFLALQEAAEAEDKRKKRKEKKKVNANK